MYPDFAKKIRSHRDLPLPLNQWNNVVRWEFSDAIPFLCSQEFFWQEGHTAHLRRSGVAKEIYEVPDLYAAVYEELLAVPVVKGQKTDKENFAGAEYTASIEGFIPAIGLGIQAATSHFWGQHLSEMFDIKVEDPDSTNNESRAKTYVWQNSWGFSTRSIGVMIMVHSANKGLGIPPRVAETQVIIIPVGITKKISKDDEANFFQHLDSICNLLRQSCGIRAELDLHEGYSPNYRFNDWALNGVPLRLEVGPKVFAASVVTASRRDKHGTKFTIPLNTLQTEVPTILDTIQKDMFQKKQIKNIDNIASKSKLGMNSSPQLRRKKVCVIRHCWGDACEEQIKKMSKKHGGLPEDSKAPSMGAKSFMYTSGAA